MKVQTKITILLVLVVATFLVGLWAFRAYDRRKFRRIAEERYNERSDSFQQFLDHHGRPLQAMVDDYTCLDDLVHAISARDTEWLSRDISIEKVDSFHANAVWVYSVDGKRLYGVDNLSSDGLSDVPIPHDAFTRLFAKQPLVHFFAKVRHGIMEIRGGHCPSIGRFRSANRAARLFLRWQALEPAQFAGNGDVHRQ